MLEALEEQKIDAMKRAAADAAQPFEERYRGALLGVMTQLELEGNWDFDRETCSFTKQS